MKKLAIFFILLISLMVIAGCNNSKKNVTRFTTDKVSPKTTITKVNNGEKTKPTPITISKKTVEFAITSHSKDVIKSDKSYHLIQGTTPASTRKIMVNNYTLSKYKPGDTKWSYVAAASLGTLKKGGNNYTIRALDAKGNEIASKSLSILYQGAENGTLVSTGSPLTLALILTAFGWVGLILIRRRRFNY